MFFVKICLIFTLLLVFHEDASAFSADSNRRHAEWQIRKIFRNRPQMASFQTKKGRLCKVSPNTPLYKWLKSAFAGESSGTIVFWSPFPPEEKIPGINSECVFPAEMQRAEIKIRSSVEDDNSHTKRPMRFDELWYYTALELNTLRMQKERKALEKKAEYSKTDTEKWLKENAALHFKILRLTKDFYMNTWKPWAIKNGYETPEDSPFRKLEKLPPDSEKCFAEFKKNDSPYIRKWQKSYKEKILSKANEKLSLEMKKYKDEMNSLDSETEKYKKEMENISAEMDSLSRKMDKLKKEMQDTIKSSP